MRNIYEIINKGKGVINTITPLNLLRIKDDSLQDNIPLKVSILSTDLDTDDITGFVSYLNSLTPNLEVNETTSIVQFLCTDTNNIYQLTGVGKGTYGFGSLQITTNNVLKFSISGGAQNLQDVTDIGNSTTNTIIWTNGANKRIEIGFFEGTEGMLFYDTDIDTNPISWLILNSDGTFSLSNNSTDINERGAVFSYANKQGTYYNDGLNLFDYGTQTTASLKSDSLSFRKNDGGFKFIDVIQDFTVSELGHTEITIKYKGTASETMAFISDITANNADALQRDGSNANSDIDLGINNLKANGLGADIVQVLGSNDNLQLRNGGVDVNEVGLYSANADQKIATYVHVDGLYKYGNGELIYDEVNDTFKWNGVSIAKITDIPIVSSADKMMTIGRNSTGTTLYKGMIVYINGSTGNRPNFVKAQANSESTSAGTFGVVYSDIANNSDGYVVTIGTISDLDTRSTATNPFTSDTLADGDTIYLSPTTAGYVTNIKPSAPNHLVYLGKVVKTNPTTGTIVYRVQNGYELDELHDVTTTNYTTPIDADSFLFFDSVNSLWKKLSLTNFKSNIKTYLDSFYGKKQDIITLTSAYVGTNTTSLQKAFNTGSSGNGSFNASANKMYRFTCELDLTGLSSTTGTVAFGILGTATITNINYKALGSKIASLATSATNTNYTTVQTTASTVITASNTGVTARLVISGIIRVTTAGTIIPAYATSVGSSTVQTEPDSFFEIYEIGSNTLTATSNIS